VRVICGSFFILLKRIDKKEIHYTPSTWIWWTLMIMPNGVFRSYHD
jgi:hypothetical protein